MSKGLGLVGIVLSGEKLVPDRITQRVQLQPTEVETAGQILRATEANVYIPKRGSWARNIEFEGDFGAAAEIADELLAGLNKHIESISDLPAVESAILDVFFTWDVVGGVESSCVTAFTPRTLELVSKLGMTLRVTVVGILRATEKELNSIGGRHTAVPQEMK